MTELFSEWEIFSELRKVKMECQQEWVWYCHHLSRKIANIISVWARATSQSSSVFRRCDDVVLEHSYSFTDDCRCWYFFSNSIILCQLCSFSTPPDPGGANNFFPRPINFFSTKKFYRFSSGLSFSPFFGVGRYIEWVDSMACVSMVNLELWIWNFDFNFPILHIFSPSQNFLVMENWYLGRLRGREKSWRTRRKTLNIPLSHV